MKYRRKAAAESIRNLLTILIGVAMALAIQDALGINNWKSLDAEYRFLTVITVIVFLLNSLRFCHGNSRLLSDCYELDTDMGPAGGCEEKDRKGNLFIDFFGILIVGIGFIVLANYVDDPESFCVIFWTVIFIDLLWMIFTLRWENFKELFNPNNIYQSWLLNNVVFLLLQLLILFAAYIGAFKDWPTGVVWTSLLTALTNTIVDGAVSGKLYFPSPA